MGAQWGHNGGTVGAQRGHNGGIMKASRGHSGGTTGAQRGHNEVFSNRRTVLSVSGPAYVQESYHDSQTVQPKGCFE